MKLRTLATAAILASVTAAPASAMISKEALNSALISSTTGGNVSGIIKGDSITIYGVVAGTYDANKARQAALNVEGVNKVISRIATKR